MVTLERFLIAQENTYRRALKEIVNGEKTSHWMWFIFPQLEGLGLSSTSMFYALKDKEESVAYLNHEVLGRRLVEISRALLALDGRSALEIFGRLDSVKLKSCMTLFSMVSNDNPVFRQVLDKYFEGERDNRTVQLLEL